MKHFLRSIIFLLCFGVAAFEGLKAQTTTLFTENFNSNLTTTNWCATATVTTTGACNSSSWRQSGAGNIRTKALTIPAGNTAKLTFNYKFSTIGSIFPTVSVTTGTCTGTFTTVATLTSQFSCFFQTIDLSAYAGQTIRIRFMNVDAAASAVFIVDDVTVTCEAPACLFNETFGTTSSSSFFTGNPNWCQASPAGNSSSGSCFASSDYVAALSSFGSSITTKALAIPAGVTYALNFNYNTTADNAHKVQIRSSTCTGTITDILTLPATTGCQSAGVSLAAYAGQTIHIRFYCGSSTAIQIDDISVCNANGVQPPGACANAASGVALASRQNGTWNDCNTWRDGNVPGVPNVDPCTYWATIDVTNRSAIISHSVTSSTAYTSTSGLGDIKNVYIDPSGTLTFTANYATSQSGDLDVCGTLTITSGQIDFDNFDLVVKNGGVVNINGGTLEVNKIIVESGGIINLNGGTLRRACGSSVAVGLEVKEGGLINVNNGSSRLANYACSLYYYTKLDGTIDCKNSLTSTNYSNIALGEVMVTSGQSTGLIRSQTAYIASHGISTTFHNAANNFFGFSTDYGGTVEFYGTSNITLASTGSPDNFYSLKVNISGAGNGLTLGAGGCTEVIGSLILAQGDLKFNDKKMVLRGTIEYTGATKLVGSNNAELVLAGKTVSTTSPCMNYFTSITTDYPSAGATSIRVENRNVNIINPELRFGTSGTLGRFHMVRHDVALLKSPLSIINELSLFTGKLQTTATNLVTVENTAANAVVHHTTNWKLSVGYVSGPLRRKVAANQTYDFPVGYPNETVFHTNSLANQLDPHHRRLTLKINAMSGINYITVHYNRNIPTCLAALTEPLTESGQDYLSVHPEGSWTILPDNPAYTIDYTARAYTWGYEDVKYGTPTLLANQYGILKRAETSTDCKDWDWITGTTRPAADQLGRVVKADAGTTPPTDTSYAERRSLTAFSEMAIGLQGPPADEPFPVELLTFTAKLNAARQAELRWVTANEQNSAHFIVERSDNAQNFHPVSAPIPAAGNKNAPTAYQTIDPSPLAGQSYYRLQQTDLDGKTAYSPIVNLTTENDWIDGFVVEGNPARDKIEIRMLFLPDAKTQFTLFDAAGKQILSAPALPNETFQTLSLANVPPGLYLLQIQNAAGKWRQKIVVAR